MGIFHVELNNKFVWIHNSLNILRDTNWKIEVFSQ